MKGLRFAHLGLNAGSGSTAFDPATLFNAGGGLYDPTNIFTLWKDTAGTTPVTAHGDAVARIDDLSGNGNHLVQATLGNRPLYNVSGSVKSILFDGTDDYFNITNCSTMLTGWTAASGAFAAKIPADPPAANAAEPLGYFGGASDGGGVYIDADGNLATAFFNTARKFFDPAEALTAWRNNTLRSTNGDFRYEIDGASKVNTATNTFAALTGNANFPRIGQSGGIEYFKGNLGRLLFIEGVLTDADMTNLRAWLAAGYA